MRILEDLDIFKDFEQEKETVVTIGNFDGLHLGHKKLITTTRKYAMEQDLLSVIITFNPHPLEVLKGDRPFYYIFSEDEKNIEIEKESIDFFIKYPFTKDFSEIEPSEFINLLIEKLRCKVLVVGEDYCFGKNRSGNVDMLMRLSQQKGIEVLKISNVVVDGERVSSSRIREALENQDIEKVNILLDKPYYVFGEVLKGNQIGRTIGFPTANIIPPSNKLLPPDGVYITKTLFNGKVYDSITNIGKNPTINNSIRTVETFIFEFEQDIYGKNIQVMFLKWVRGVKKFSGIGELKQQIAKDIGVAISFFDTNKTLEKYL